MYEMVDQEPFIATARTSALGTALALSLAIGLAGCATRLTRQDCDSTDFYKMGVEDGNDGRSSERFTSLSDRCKEIGATVVNNKYLYGRQVGLAKFCTDSRAERDAQNGMQTSVCMQEKVPPYERAYNLALSKLKERKTNALRDVQDSQSSLQKKEDGLDQDLKRIDEQQKSAPQN